MRDRQPPPATSHGATIGDAEEFSDLYFHRPLAARLVRVLLHTPITPNQVTLLSGMAGVLAALALALGVDRPLLRLGAGVLLLASTILDCCDGQLARARKVTSANGMMFDAATDVVVGLSMVLAAAYVVVKTTGSERLWVLAPVSLASYGLQCFLFDVVKEQFFSAHNLHYTSSKGEYVDQRSQGRTTAQSWLFDQYWRAAGALIRPSSTAAARPVIGRAAMRMWTTMGQGTHMTCLYVAAALSWVWPPALYACLLVFSLAMNIVIAGLFLVGASPLKISGA